MSLQKRLIKMNLIDLYYGFKLEHLHKCEHHPSNRHAVTIKDVPDPRGQVKGQK